MNFLDSIKLGVDKAKEADAAKVEVDNVFKEINEELRHFDKSKIIKISRSMSLGAKAVTISSFLSATTSEYRLEDVITLHVGGGGGSELVEVAKWRQHLDGFPCTLSFEGEEFVCTTSEDLKSAFSMLFGTAGFGRSLMLAIDKIDRKIKNNPSSGPVVAP